jgi:DNA repair exonuclease SbcCD ATPase subunit
MTALAFLAGIGIFSWGLAMELDINHAASWAAGVVSGGGGLIVLWVRWRQARDKLEADLRQKQIELEAAERKLERESNDAEAESMRKQTEYLRNQLKDDISTLQSRMAHMDEEAKEIEDKQTKLLVDNAMLQADKRHLLERVEELKSLLSSRDAELSALRSAKHVQ